MFVPQKKDAMAMLLCGRVLMKNVFEKSIYDADL